MRRRPSEGLIAGVCAGAAARLGVSTLLVRIVVLVGLCVAFTPVLIGYLAAWFLMDTEFDEWRNYRG